MPNWVDVILEDQLAMGQHQVIFYEEYAIAVFNIGGEFYAIEDSCSHQQLPLSDGHLKGDVIECPFHGAQFCIKTGQVKAPPAFDNIRTFPVRVLNNMIQVEVSPRT
jgi:3-phenylpropionate/trans-cinnamate dioxygenase ferredoxin component